MDTFAQFSTGRILLHALCALRTHKWTWHWAGVVRELRHQFDPQRTLRERVNARNVLRAGIVIVGLLTAIS